jgi:hypothetical protein
MVATQFATSTASALAPQPMDAKMVTTVTTPSNNDDPVGFQDLAPSASESATAIASMSEELVTPVSDDQRDADANLSLTASPDEKRAAHETDTVASADRDITEDMTTCSDEQNVTDEANTVISTESSTAKEVAKESSAAALPKSEDAEQSNQDLQDDETSMEQSRAAKARSFPSAAGYLSFHSKRYVDFHVECHHSFSRLWNQPLHRTLQRRMLMNSKTVMIIA